MKLSSAVLLLLTFIFLFTATLLAQNVIIVVVDGSRYSETFGAGNKYIPHLYNDLKPLGTLYSNCRINHPKGYTVTCPGHAAVETGTWQPIDNNGNERPTKPTIFEYIRKEDGIAKSKCYVVSGKKKLNILTYSTYKGYGSEYGAKWVGDDNKDDGQTYNKVISVMKNYKPKILVINFAQVDNAGHDGNWNDYISAIKGVDNYIYKIWKQVENGDWGYTSKNTTMFITNDHGRHDDSHGGFENHGDGCDGCTHIMLLALGRGITPDKTINNRTWQIDIAPTVGELLSFDLPVQSGNSLLSSIESTIPGKNNSNPGLNPSTNKYIEDIFPFWQITVTTKFFPRQSLFIFYPFPLSVS